MARKETRGLQSPQLEKGQALGKWDRRLGLRMHQASLQAQHTQFGEGRAGSEPPQVRYNIMGQTKWAGYDGSVGGRGVWQGGRGVWQGGSEALPQVRHLCCRVLTGHASQ